uniref:Pancreatic trypsin inhibitor n=1 Tax=Rhipicephalus appendiculatus TaxID=34631 RepID=A0A131YFG7_RHIAP
MHSSNSLTRREHPQRMRLFQYSILACLMICVIADDEDEGAGPDSDETPMQQPTITDSSAGRTSTGTNNPGGQGGLHKRCTFKPDQTNCAGHNFPRMWVYRPDTDTCEPISLPTCWSKSGVFRRCKRCMKVCMRHTKRAGWRRRIRQFCRKSANSNWKQHSLN